MEKLKKIWRENKVLLVLAVILVICLIVLVSVAIAYGYGTNDSSYETPAKLEDKVLTNTKNKIDESEKVKSSSVILKRKTIYISIVFDETTTLDEAKAIASSSLEVYSENQLKETDLSFSIIKEGENGFTLWGARNIHGSGEIIWGNYNINTNVEKENE